jgi:hypothetical protein
MVMNMEMLLAGLLLHAQRGSGSDPDREPAGACDGEFWNHIGALERRMRDAEAVVARLLASLALLGFLFAMLDAAAPAQPDTKAQASFTPFSMATWSESIGR